MQSLVLGGVIGALAGMIYALARQLGARRPTSSTFFTFSAYMALILGGTARVWGPVVGAVLFDALLQFTGLFLRDANDSFIPSWLIGDNERGRGPRSCSWASG